MRILIVGASRGLGLALAREALRRHADATVFATARNVRTATELTRLREDSDGRLHLLALDLLDADSLRKAADQLRQGNAAENHQGGLDELWLNAGIFTGIGRITDLDDAAFEATLRTNVMGPHACLRAFAPLLLESAAPRRGIYLISSSVGSLGYVAPASQRMKALFQTPFLPAGAYSVSKTALNMLARQWADELEPQGIVVALLHPGTVATDGMRDIFGELGTDAAKGMADAIEPDKSARGLFEVAERVTPEQTAKGILAWNDSTLPW